MRQRVLSVLVLMFVLLAPVSTVFCTDLDSIHNSSTGQNTQQSSGSNTGDNAFDSISDYMRGHDAVSKKDMESASKIASPIVALIGKATGVIILLVDALIFLVTALDLLYIAVPFTRKYLNPANLQQGGGMMPGMGMGARMGMGMSMGGGAQGTVDPNAHKWVSDEAVAAIMMSQPQQQGGMTGGMGMGMGMGGYGGMQQQQPQQQQSTKSTITTYFKKRIIFIVVFAIATTILMSSILVDCGLNLAQLMYKILGVFNDGISNVNI